MSEVTKLEPCPACDHQLKAWKADYAVCDFTGCWLRGIPAPVVELNELARAARLGREIDLKPGAIQVMPFPDDCHVQRVADRAAVLHVAAAILENDALTDRDATTWALQLETTARGLLSAAKEAKP